jgi:hypothetical protein
MIRLALYDFERGWMMSASVAVFPVHKRRDDRRSGKLADALLTLQVSSRMIGDFNAA